MEKFPYTRRGHFANLAVKLKFRPRFAKLTNFRFSAKTMAARNDPKILQHMMNGRFLNLEGAHRLSFDIFTRTIALGAAKKLLNEGEPCYNKLDSRRLE